MTYSHRQKHRQGAPEVILMIALTGEALLTTEDI
jgi:hypothetical protein